MIRSAIFSKFRCRGSCTIKKTLERRLFASGSGIVNYDRDDNDGEREALLETIFMDDELRNSMVYSLAMASLEGSKFPPLMRSLNDREREQLRISKIQHRQFRSGGHVTVKAGEDEKEQQIGNNIAHRQRQHDRESFFRAMGEDQGLHHSLAYSLAMAIDLEESEFPPLTRSLNEREKEQLRVSRDQIRHERMIATNQLYGNHSIGTDTTSVMKEDDIDLDVDEYDILSMANSDSFASSLKDEMVKLPQPTSKSPSISKCTYPEQRRREHDLPRTLHDALLPSSEAIVITETEMPFRVFNVNAAWEGLCGYSYVESKGKSLGSLLSGKETEACAVTALIHQLFVHGEQATTVLTNYTKDGRKFHNRLSVGPLYDEETNEVSHFVGILKEVSMAA